ncbi:hypothetical protein NE237_027951 [Protea cynaroides]|uniref:Complex 1 LYR protein domain-containing protein n=1 Tax=Protea cynaroides TaxID=273540 RepID=A0A9Q0GPH5_9MAGN|nr:hypothetical protein NE237_027951 [Protea cynaroides]
MNYMSSFGSPLYVPPSSAQTQSGRKSDRQMSGHRASSVRAIEGCERLSEPGCTEFCEVALTVILPVLREHLEVKKDMPSLQTALPPELANNVIRLYRECLRRARFIGHRQHNTQVVVDMVRQQFRKHMHETDPDKIQKLKDDAARGLINHILYESEKMSVVAYMT